MMGHPSKRGVLLVIMQTQRRTLKLPQQIEIFF